MGHEIATEGLEHTLVGLLSPKGYDRLNNAHEVAQAAGFVVVLPAPNELFVDIDREEDLGQLAKGLEILGQVYRCEHVIKPSCSEEPGHYHVVVKLYNVLPVGLTACVCDSCKAVVSRGPDPVQLTDAERVLLQCLLGSDRVREALSWLQIQRNVESPTLFFEFPEVTSHTEKS